jgi:hypothetical protein
MAAQQQDTDHAQIYHRGHLNLSEKFPNDAGNGARPFGAKMTALAAGKWPLLVVDL